ncbi:MAG: GNAT family N-acetyltransferase [Planctomycetaceae bacterium]
MMDDGDQTPCDDRARRNDRIQIIRVDHLMTTLARLRGISTPIGTDFSGLIALQDGRPSIAVGYSFEPDNTLSLTLPIWLNNHAVSELKELIGECIRMASEAGLKGAHCLAPISESFQIETLRLAGFRKAATVVSVARRPVGIQLNHLQNRGERETDSEIEWNAQPLSPKMFAQRSDDIVAALEEILSNSTDLLQIPRPSPDELEAVWGQKNGIVVTGCIGNHVCAIACVSLNNDQSYLRGESGGNTFPAPFACIEYIGVVPKYRRRRLGRRLLEECDRVFGDWISENKFGLHVGSTMAFVDSSNEPAMQFYARCGFVSVNSYSLLFMDAEVG